MNIYELSRSFWDFAFENPDRVKPNHVAVYFFAIEHCNRLGWKEKFGLPTTMAMEAIGIKTYNTYISTFRDLVEWGFIDIIQKSKNQHSSNIIALNNKCKALDKALDKALLKHSTKQSESTIESSIKSKVSIDKPITRLPLDNLTAVQENENQEEVRKKEKRTSEEELKKIEGHDEVFRQLWESNIWLERTAMLFKSETSLVKSHLNTFRQECISKEEYKETEKDAKNHFVNWIKRGNPLPDSSSKAKRKLNSTPQ